MRVFVVGGTGAIGRRLVPLLVDRGDVVVATTTSAARSDDIAGMGAEPMVLDLLDRGATIAAVLAAKPDVVLHQATALAGRFDVRRLDRFFTRTNLLRTVGTDHLLAAAREAGVPRLVAQSYTGWPNARGTGPATEDDPLEPQPPASARKTIDAIRYVEASVPAARGIDGVVLRYGSFYGPGTSLGPGGEFVEMVRARRFPIVGDGSGVWSFLHIDDAATATVRAIDDAAPGLYNIVDDDPAPVREWLPVLADALGAKPPRHVPAALARLAVGSNGVRVMTGARGSTNTKAKSELGWTPVHASWREGFRTLAV
ncbi:MAG TPA: NAD(P)-dependent oxidoreductase [Mycobacteriales bacterium]|nr:NAD(P)-dependent oxidoreductase [Mycobacteriales bacterium]